MIGRTHLPRISWLAPSSTHPGYVPVNPAYLHMPLRVRRHESRDSRVSPLDYGAYFEAIQQGICRGGFGRLVDAASRASGDVILVSDVREIKIIAEKHGSDYHPARVELTGPGVRACLAVNVAVTPRGKARLHHEVEVLRYLNAKAPGAGLPRVYFQAEPVVTPTPGAGPVAVPMFVADWFDGYHEFHLSVDSPSGARYMVLWDTEKGRRKLSSVERRKVYAAASEVMARLYDVRTFEQVFPWHHAAGDFVARVDGDAVSVKLVTARQYAAMLDPAGGVSPCEALLFFLMNLSLRMRLDRLDGVGPVTWAEDDCVDATLEGFNRGLRAQAPRGTDTAGVVAGFGAFCRGLSKQALAERFDALVGACDCKAPDMPVVRAHLKAHISIFSNALSTWGRFPDSPVAEFA